MARKSCLQLTYLPEQPDLQDLHCALSSLPWAIPRSGGSRSEHEPGPAFRVGCGLFCQTRQRPLHPELNMSTPHWPAVVRRSPSGFETEKIFTGYRS